MITYLKDREVYEDRYDRETVEIGRREGTMLGSAFLETIDKWGDQNIAHFWENRLYWWLFEIPYLLPRWEGREQTIESWMFEDKMLDKRLEEARPRVEPRCSSCKGHGLRLVNKLLMRREYGDDKQSVLFMFDCTHCKKRTACWEDGTEWESPTIPCPKCQSPLDEDVTVKGHTMTTTATCLTCGYTNTEKTKIGIAKDPEDPLYEEHRKVFCLDNKRGVELQAYRKKLKEMLPFLEEDMKREENKELYAKAAEIQKLKIPQIIDLLRPAIEAAGYREVTFDKPNLGGYVSIGFSCMDSEVEREDTKSRKILKQAVTKTLENTNWRLMSEGISYRLGYLTGMLRAYEQEKDIVHLVSDK